MTYRPFTLHGQHRPSRFLITCDHATNTVPPQVNGGDLGLGPEDMGRHIAYDVGAFPLSLALGERLDAPVVASNFSRLVIDPNRGTDDPTLLMKIYDGSIIPANRHADAAERQRRIDLFYQPYHDALAKLAARPGTVIVSMHSFTPRLRGHVTRPWHIGVLHTDDTRFSDPLIAALEDEGDLVVGDNQPYTGKLAGDAVDRHGTAHDRPNALIEVRNDLIACADGQQAWADRLARVLTSALAKSGL